MTQEKREGYIEELTQEYIMKIKDLVCFDDMELIYSIIKNGFIGYENMTDEELSLEYDETFGEDGSY